jgi:hypothetical protein
MTTLPQTTNARLPRPQQGAMQVHQGPGGGMLGAHTGGQGGGQGGGNGGMRVIHTEMWKMKQESI